VTTTGRGLAVTSPQLIYSEDGKHCYAYNTTPATTTAFNIFSFTSGPGMIKGWIQFNGYVNAGSAGSGNQGTLDVMFNGVTVIILKTETELETSSPHSLRCPIIIPPLTVVTASIDASVNEALHIATVVLIGKVSPVPAK